MLKTGVMKRSVLCIVLTALIIACSNPLGGGGSNSNRPPKVTGITPSGTETLEVVKEGKEFRLAVDTEYYFVFQLEYEPAREIFIRWKDIDPPPPDSFVMDWTESTEPEVKVSSDEEGDVNVEFYTSYNDDPENDNEDDPLTSTVGEPWQVKFIFDFDPDL